MFGRKYFDHVDYRSLPEDLQIRVVKAVKQGWGSTMDKKPPVLSSPTGPHAVLFVLETAPWEVVNAAYKALALKLHPDKGGSAEDFQQLQKAYEQLKAKYNT
jgi:DnaJ-class molecular chaperone